MQFAKARLLSGSECRWVAVGVQIRETIQNYFKLLEQCPVETRVSLVRNVATKPQSEKSFDVKTNSMNEVSHFQSKLGSKLPSSGHWLCL